MIPFLGSGPASQPSLRLQAWLAGPQAWLDGPEEGWMDGRTDVRTENLPILQDFVPYQGCCPASPMKTKEEVERGKGTADRLMPLGYTTN